MAPASLNNVRRAAGSNVLEGDSDDEKYAAPEQRVPACLPCIKSSRITGILDCRPHPAGAACNRCSRYKKSLCDYGEELHARNPLLRRRLHDLQRTMDGGRHIASPKMLATRDANNKIIQSGHNAKMTDESAITSATNSCWRSSASPPRPSARPIQAILALATATQARPEPRPARYLPAPPPRPLRPVYGPPVAAPRPRPGPYERFDQLRRGPPPPPASAAQAPARDPPSPSVLAMFRQDARRRPQQEPAARPVAAAQAPVAPPRPAAAPQLRVRYDKDAPEYREYYESDPREYDQYEDG
ncbi:hypothetical protein MCOR03_011259 [Pyricularia oryzae]|nr:hypothetical protein MCOR03_011259 [Pyricularia oryzae]